MAYKIFYNDPVIKIYKLKNKINTYLTPKRKVKK